MVLQVWISAKKHASQYVNFDNKKNTGAERGVVKQKIRCAVDAHHGERFESNLLSITRAQGDGVKWRED